MEENNEIFEVKLEEKRELEKLEKIGWGLFLVMLGGIWLFPDSIVPEGTFMFGVGVILVGLNLMKYSKGYKVNGFTVYLNPPGTAGFTILFRLFMQSDLCFVGHFLQGAICLIVVYMCMSIYDEPDVRCLETISFDGFDKVVQTLLSRFICYVP